MTELVDLSQDFNLDVFTAFYNNLLRQNFNATEVESFEDVRMDLKWTSNHEQCKVKSCDCRRRPRVGAAVLLSDNQRIAGGIVYDYYPLSNFGLIANVVVDKHEQGRGLCRKLLEHAIIRLKEISAFHGYDKIKEIVTEVHRRNTKQVEQPINVLTRQKIYQKLGFRQVVFPYKAPPLNQGDSPTSDFHLLAYRPEVTCDYQVEGGALPGRISAKSVIAFVNEYWSAVTEKKPFADNGVSYEIELDIKASLPWTESGCESSPNSVIVIGGGLAGLSAAASLSQAGVNVILVEAAGYLGGRVKQVQAFEGYTPIDMGAEFIHGSTTVVNELARENNWHIEEVYNHEGVSDRPDPRGIYYKGQIRTVDSKHPDIQAYLQSWEKVIEYGQDLVTRSDKSKDLSIKEFLKKEGYSQDVMNLFQTIHCQFEGASLNSHGMMELVREEMVYDYGYENFRLKESMKILVKHFIEQCSMVDKCIDWKAVKVERQENTCTRGCVKVTSANGKEIYGSHVIVTVPLKILQDKIIDFYPPLPPAKLNAIDTVKMHGGLKITCQFKRQFWEESLQMLYAVDCWISTMWMFTLGPNSDGEQCYVITGFETADIAEDKKDVPEKEVLENFLEQLDTIFGIQTDPKPASSSFLGHVYYHWSKDPHVRGAYSSGTVGAFGLRADLASTVDGYLFFAGEHTNVKSTATVHAAIETGQRAAEEVLQSRKCLSGV